MVAMEQSLMTKRWVSGCAYSNMPLTRSSNHRDLRPCTVKMAPEPTAATAAPPLDAMHQQQQLQRHLLLHPDATAQHRCLKSMHTPRQHLPCNRGELLPMLTAAATGRPPWTGSETTVCGESVPLG